MKLYTHQEEAIEELRNGSILCGGVGSGKSRAAIAYYFLKEGKGKLCINGSGSYSPMKNKIPLYIITTARKRDTLEWEQEYIPFLLDKENVVVDSWNNIKKYKDVENAFFIFDEQRLVGYGAWVKSFLKIVKSNRWILLTATPGDTWSDYIPVFIANGFYKNKTDFTRQHVVYSRFSKYPKIDRYIGTKQLERQRQQIIVNMEFTKPTIQIHRDIIVPYEKLKEKEILKRRWNIFEDRPIRDSAEVCYLLRRVVNSDPRRVQEVKEILKHHDRIIVFYNFNYELELLRELGKDYGINTKEWNGHKHEPLPKTKKWIYLVQYTAGAEGWNCTDTNVIVFYSQNYSYKIMIQAAGRIDRLNTPFVDLYYYHLKSKSQIDLAINRALKNKKNFNERLFMR